MYAIKARKAAIPSRARPTQAGFPATSATIPATPSVTLPTPEFAADMPTRDWGTLKRMSRFLHRLLHQASLHDPATRDYIARRAAEGKSTRDTTRILKRYV